MLKTAKISTILRLLMISVVVIQICIGALAFAKLITIRDHTSNLHDRELPNALQVEELRYHVIQIQQWLTDSSATKAKPGYDDGFNQAKSHYDSANKIIDTFIAQDVDKEEFTSLKTDLDNYYQMGIKMANAYIDGGTDAGNQIMNQFDPYAEKITKSLESMLSKYVTATDDSAKGIDNQVTLMLYTLLGLTVFAIFVIILVVWRTASTITRQVEIFKSRLYAISDGDGDLTQIIQMPEHTEFGQMSSLFNKFLKNMKEIILQIMQNSDVIHKGSSKLDLAVTESSQDIQQITCKAVEVSNSMKTSSLGINESKQIMEDLTSGLDLVLERTKLAETSSQAVLQVAVDGGKDIQSAVESVENVKTASIKMNTVIEELVASTEKVQKMAAAITSIAAQTNLLALNASIESARAGEAGRGFSVVAEEIRKLAEESKISATEINSLIQDIQLKTDSAQSTISDELVQVQNSVLVSNGASRKFQSILNEIDQVVTQLEAISKESTSQTQVAHQLNTFFGEIDETVTDSATASDEITERIQQISSILQTISIQSSELNQQSDSLNSITSRFKV